MKSKTEMKGRKRKEGKKGKYEEESANGGRERESKNKCQSIRHPLHVRTVRTSALVSDSWWLLASRSCSLARSMSLLFSFTISITCVCVCVCVQEYLSVRFIVCVSV
jgi:hypothetical protein